ncbi:MAG: phage tail protein [Candidatus Dormibacteria bacterium]
MANELLELAVLLRFKEEGQNVLKESEGGLTSFGGAAAMAGTVAVTALAAAGTAVAAFAVESVQHAEEAGHAVYEMSEKFGLSSNSAAQWVIAGEQLGLTSDQISGGFKFLDKNIEAVNLQLEKGKGATGPQAEAFKELGVNVTDATGKLRDTDSIMGDVADAFSRMEDGPEKAGLAMKLFGRSGADLIPLLNEGRAATDGLSEADKKAAQGLADNAAAAQKLYLAHRELDVQVGALQNRVGAGLIPAFTAGTQALTGFLDYIEGPGIAGIQAFVTQHKQQFDEVQAKVQQVMSSVQELVQVALELIQAIWKARGEQMVKFVTDMFNAISAVVTDVINYIKDLIQLALDVINGHWDKVLGDLKNIAGDVFNGIKDLVSLALTNVLGSIDIFTGGAIARFEQWIGDTLAKLGGLKDDAVKKAQELGDGIINGIADAIRNGPGAIKSALQAAVGDAISFAKGILGIHSPSTVFAEAIGLPIIQGIAQGITGGQAEVQGALSAVSAMGASAQVGGAVGGARSGAGGASSGSSLSKRIADDEDRLVQIFTDEPKNREMLQANWLQLLKDLLEGRKTQESAFVLQENQFTVEQEILSAIYQMTKALSDLAQATAAAAAGRASSFSVGMRTA